MKTDIQTELTQALRSHEKVWANEEKTILAKNILLDLVEKTDPTIIGLLLGNDELKRHFFVEVNDVLVFKLQDFRFFLDKHSINNSYTKYANRIGLTDGNRFLKDSSDIVLDFPFKDCVLNGGQSTEEGEEIYFKRNNSQPASQPASQLYTKLTRKRQEIFFNQTLAFDEIDRLFDAKAFSKFSRYTADGKQAVGEIKRHFDGTPAENLIIKGNNLIALHSLAKQFKGKVKLIYIDPPYNTGEDSFKYNDKFSHSTWLTFMKNRLEIAKTLLADDGVIFVQCDDKEQAYLKVLLDETFTRENFINCIAVKMSEPSGNKMAHTSHRLPKIKEYILIYKNKNIKLNPIREQKSEWDDEYNIFLDNFTQEDKKFIDLIVNSQTENKEINGNTLKEIDILLKKISPISVNQKLAQLNIKDNEVIKWKLDNAYRIVRTAASSSVKKLADEKKGNCQQQFFSVISKRDRLLYIVKSDYSKDAKAPRVQVLFAEDYLSISLCDLWTNINTTGLEAEGNVELKNGKKPESLIETIIKLATNESDIVLDYHLGSGTTAAVAHKMNRQYIGIEQMDYIETLAVERLKKVIDGEQGGISKAVNWQGGGEFVYAELAPFNETAKQQILACESSDDIKTLFNELCERYFLKYNVSVKEFSQIIEEPEFQSLPLDEQKQMVLEMLDLNQMYVSLSEMDDEQFADCLNDDDKALSRAFYQSVKNQAEKKDGE
ncbi:DNA methyltransferase [Haemophilus aegyptius]|uniref:site-specific DNA-methyltransferase (adenine-specific) n=1 Tax=Haemophilus aegyptius TaxID=197575 RepID=A0ABY1VW96_HAEAE|nr:site-specific DNA-methyltransferase [Haemophilus aegyptius]UAK83458.1 site-specific DNA-methyltransferase [Haemophilus aegyptius]SQH37165.1 type iii restriction-modification system hindvip enzyme mod [Haemophilus aegyptius]